MRKPEEIQKDIDQLQKELKQSKEYHQYDFLVDDSMDSERIGFFNIGKAKLILQYLQDGRTLQLRHEYQGNVEVWMNPQRNRILVQEHKHYTEENIMNYIVRYPGTWFVKEE